LTPEPTKTSALASGGGTVWAKIPETCLIAGRTDNGVQEHTTPVSRLSTLIGKQQVFGVECAQV
jgi:hypothetical protein